MKQSNWKNNKGKFKGQTGVWESENIDKGKRPTPQQRNTFSTDVVPERAILVSVCDAKSSMERTEECLNELAFLLETAGGVPVKSVIQKLDRPDSRTYIVEPTDPRIIEETVDLPDNRTYTYTVYSGNTQLDQKVIQTSPKNAGGQD